jgi:hypothetical protein
MNALDELFEECGTTTEMAQLRDAAIAELAKLRAELDGHITAEHKYLRLNVEFHNSNAQLRAKSEADDAAFDYMVELVGALNEALDEATEVIKPFAEQGIIANDWPLPDSALVCQISFPDCKAAAVWYEEHKEVT